MNLEQSLNITPEGLLRDIPTVIRRETLGESTETAYMEFPTTRVETTLKESMDPKSLPGTKEACRAEVLASTRQFFATIDHRNINVPTVDQTTVAEVHARDQSELAEAPTTSMVPTTTSSVIPHVVLDENLISSPRVSLPEGSPLCPYCYCNL